MEAQSLRDDDVRLTHDGDDGVLIRHGFVDTME
jgi:hypothetical protein